MDRTGPIFPTARIIAGLVFICGDATSGALPGKFDITVGGNAYFTTGYASEGYDGANGTTQKMDFTNRVRLNVTPIATADNGMRYGANLRIRAFHFSGMIDANQAYLFAEGQFGHIEAGLNFSPNNQYGVTAPHGFGTGGVVGDWAEGNGWIKNQSTFMEAVFGGAMDGITNTNWSNRITYSSPRLFSSYITDTNKQTVTGLIASASFVPKNAIVGTGVNRTKNITTTAQSYCRATYPAQPTTVSGCGYQNVFEANLRYDNNLNGITFAASAGYEHGDAPRDITGVTYHPLSALQAGLQFGYAGVLIGGSYTNAGKSSYASNRGYLLSDQSVLTAGISYETGPLVFGFNYAHGQDAGDITVAGRRTANLFSTGTTYTVAPGLTTSLEYLRSITHNEAGFQADPYGIDARGTPVSAGGTGYGSGNASLILWKTVVAF